MTLYFFPLRKIVTNPDGSRGCDCGPGCKTIGKHPGVRGFTTQPGAEGSYWPAGPDGTGQAWEGCGKGLPTGSINGFFVVDLDIRPARGDKPAVDGLASLEAIASKHAEPLPDTYVVKTPSGGAHVYYKNPPGVRVKTSGSQLGPGIDIRGEGGFTVAPYSPHKTGGVYTPIDESATIADAPQWLLDLVTDYTPRQHTTNLPESVLTDKTGTELEKAIAHAREYLQKAEPCTEDGTSSAKLGKYAAHVRGKGIPVTTCLELLQEFDERCEPPWGEDELKRMLVSVERGPIVAQVAAESAAATSFMRSFFPDAQPQLPQPPKDPPTADDPLRGLEHLSRVAVVGRDKIVELSERPVVWLWNDVASAGLTVLLAAAPSSGKTTLLFLLIAARLNTGEPVEVLGHTVTPAPEGKWVVVIEAEHSDESASRILRKSCAQQGISEEALDRVILVARGSVKLGSPAWKDVETLIKAGLVSDVVLDTLARVAPDGDEANAEGAQVAIFDAIAQTIEMAPDAADRPTFWVAAHLRKTEGIPTLNDVSGSTQRAGQADVVLLMAANRSDQKVKSVTCAFGKVREKDPDDWPMPVEYVVRKTGIVTIDAPAADDRPLKEQIVTRLELGVPLTRNNLRTKLNRSAEDVEEAISELFKERRIDKTMIRARGKEYAAFMLRPGATAEDRERQRKMLEGLAGIRVMNGASKLPTEEIIAAPETNIS